MKLFFKGSVATIITAAIPQAPVDKMTPSRSLDQASDSRSMWTQKTITEYFRVHRSGTQEQEDGGTMLRLGFKTGGGQGRDYILHQVLGQTGLWRSRAETQ